MAPNEPIVDKGTIDLMTRASVLIGGIGGGASEERQVYDIDILALFDRCRSMLGATRLLLAYDFVHEAVGLGRPLFIDSLALTEFAAGDEKARARLAARRRRAGLVDLEQLFREAERRGDDLTAELAGVASSLRELDIFVRDRELGRTPAWRADDATKALAKKHGREDEYVALLVTHHFVHGSSLATSQRYTKVADDAVEVGGPAAQLKVWADDAGLFATKSALHAARAACSIFGWPESAELKDLLIEIEALANRSDGSPDREP